MASKRLLTTWVVRCVAVSIIMALTLPES